MAAPEDTQLGDLPEECLSHAIALTSPRDACRFAAVSPAFRVAADSDYVWQRFIPPMDHILVLPQHQVPVPDEGAPSRKTTAAQRRKDAYLGLCDRAAGVPVDDGDGGCRVWLEKASGAKCYALSARRLSLPWDDGEYSWRWTPHLRSRFSEVAELVDCTCLEIFGRLPMAALLTPAITYAAYLVYGTIEGHRGLSYPDQETAVSIGGRVLERHRVCLRPDDAETSKFRGAGVADETSSYILGGGEADEPRGPTRRSDGWWEMEMGRLSVAAGENEDEVVASFEVLGWYAKRGLLVEAIEFRPV